MGCQKQKSGINIDTCAVHSLITEAMLTDPELLERTVQTYRKRVKRLAKATAIGLQTDRSARADGGPEDLLGKLGYEAPEGAELAFPAEGGLCMAVIVYTKRHCAFVEWDDKDGIAELRGAFRELKGAKARPAATGLPFRQLFRRI